MKETVKLTKKIGRWWYYSCNLRRRATKTVKATGVRPQVYLSSRMSISAHVITGDCGDLLTRPRPAPWEKNVGSRWPFNQKNRTNLHSEIYFANSNEYFSFKCNKILFLILLIISMILTFVHWKKITSIRTVQKRARQLSNYSLFWGQDTSAKLETAQYWLSIGKNVAKDRLPISYRYWNDQHFLSSPLTTPWVNIRLQITHLKKSFSKIEK